MVEVFVLDQDTHTRVRLEAARIFRLRRPITRSNALRDLDRQIVREAASAGHRRGAAFSIADDFLDAVRARLTELERQVGECTVARNVVRLHQREGAAA